VELGGKVEQGQIFLRKFSVSPVSCHSSNTPEYLPVRDVTIGAFEVTHPVIWIHLIAKTRKIVLCIWSIGC
jgi:hypothetical protein